MYRVSENTVVVFEQCGKVNEKNNDRLCGSQITGGEHELRLPGGTCIPGGDGMTMFLRLFWRLFWWVSGWGYE